MRSLLPPFAISLAPDIESSKPIMLPDTPADLAIVSATDWLPAFWTHHAGFASIAEAAARHCCWQEWPEPAPYYDALSRDAPVRFIGVDVSSYEDHIAETGEVPTRHACWHDLFNALIWHGYPSSKGALNGLHQLAKHSGEVRHSDGASQRGRRRDAATLFDENGALVWSDDPQLLALIRAMDWPMLFLQHRAAFGRNLHVRLFGHGLLDQLRRPFLGLTAHALLLQVDRRHVDSAAPVSQAQQDQWLCAAIKERAGHWTPADLAPLPILGIPGWWPNNDAPGFYDNTQYFRRERRRQPERKHSN